ncbi:MAG: NAD-dependent epimerase/dehydratase family protein [Acidobacteriota bacterium]
MAHYLITGGAGFIGSHLAEALIARGHRLTLLDNLSSGRRENISHLQARFVEASVTDRAVLDPLVDEADAVFHLAATVGVYNIVRSPVETIANNINGTECVLEAACPGKRKVVIASTSEVYGKSTRAPFREDDDLLLGPTSKSRWSYAASKIIDEFLALAYWHERGVPALATRFFNTIGPRQTGRYGMVVPRFLTHALSGRNLPVHGSGDQSRSFTYVGDVVEWLCRLVELPGTAGKVFNLGNPSEITIRGLAELVIQMTGSSSGIDFIPYAEAYEPGFEDIERRVPDISRIVQFTGYSPLVPLREAIELTREWMLKEGIPT